MKLLFKLDEYVEKICAFFLVASILLLLLFSCLTIILRWVHINLMWIDPLVRHLVFLATFMGGAVATGRGTHIAIDLVSKVFEVKEWHQAQVWVNRLIYLVCSISLIWLFISGYEFTVVEKEFSKPEFLGIPSYYLVAIIPIGFALIAFRFSILFLKSFTKKDVAA